MAATDEDGWGRMKKRGGDDDLRGFFNLIYLEPDFSGLFNCFIASSMMKRDLRLFLPVL